MLPLLTISSAFASDGPSSGSTSLVAGLVVLVLACAALVAVMRPVGVLVSALAGAGVAGYLAHEHLATQSGADSLCNINETWNCALVNSSAWSEVLGVPIALYGFGVYCALGFLAVRWNQGKSDAAVVIAVGATIGVCVDLFLGAQMLRLGAGCVLCLTTYALNLVILIGAGLEARKRLSGAATAFGNHAAVAAIVGLATYLGALTVYRSTEGAGGPPSASGGAAATAPADLSKFYEQAVGDVAYETIDPVYGDPAARFTLVEWADFQCPHCQWMYGQLHELLADPVNKDVKLVYRNYPISNQCNQFVAQAGHSNACAAAAAGECAREQGRFWELAGAMFKNQEYLSTSDVRFMVEQNGLDAAAFEVCLGKPAIGERVLKDVEAGGKAGVQGTPSVYLLGAFGDKWVRLKGDKNEMAAVLAAVRAGTPLPAPPPPEEPPQ